MPKGRPDFLIADPFYETLPGEKGWPPSPGQICWARIAYPYDPPKALAYVDGSFSAWTGEARFKICTLEKGVIPSSHMPIKELDLQSDETLLIQRSKERRVVILSATPSGWFAKKPEPTYLVAPCFAFKERHQQRFVLEVQGLRHPILYYMPPSAAVHESAIRLDLVQPVSLGGLRAGLVDGKHWRLTDTASRYLVYQIGRQLTGKGTDDLIDGDLDAYAGLLLETLT